MDESLEKRWRPFLADASRREDFFLLFDSLRAGDVRSRDLAAMEAEHPVAGQLAALFSSYENRLSGKGVADLGGMLDRAAGGIEDGALAAALATI